MRILLVSWAFPPYNSSGAIRVGKTAKYLHRLGHDVRVLTARGLPVPATARLEIPEAYKISTPYIDSNHPIQAVLGGRQRVAERGYTRDGGAGGGMVRVAILAYRAALHLPDAQVGWLPFAVRGARTLLRQWQPDVVYASAHPITGFLVGRRVARTAMVPWIAEYRDLWLEEPSYPFRGFRRRLDQRLEQSLLRSAAGVVTVSDPLAEVLRGKTTKPVVTVLNGYDTDDVAEPAPTAPGRVLELLYTGMLYEGRQDPRPLFTAVQHLGAARRHIRIRFYGRYLTAVERIVREMELTDVVEVHPPVSHEQAVEMQSGADVLLLFPFLTAADRGAYGAKFFEYLGAGRPILGVGPRITVAADAIIEHAIGTVIDEPSEIAAALRKWIAQKQATGIAPVSTAVTREFTREQQTAKLVEFMERLVGRSHSPPAAAQSG